MADQDDIVQKIRFEGEEDVMSAFQRIGTAGQKAFNDIRNAASTTASAYNQVVSQAKATFQAIETGATNADVEMKKLEQDATKLGQSFTQAARTIGAAAAGIANAFGGNFIRSGLAAVQFDLNRLVQAAINAKDRIVSSARQITQAFAQTTIGTRLVSQFGSASSAAKTLGSSLASVGSSALRATRNIALIGGGVTAAVAGFKALTRAATGQAAASRVASREALADIRDEKGDRMGLFNINQQAIAQRRQLDRQMAAGTMTIEEHTAALQELEAQTAENTRAFFQQDAAEEQARKKQFDETRKLREKEAFENVADKVGNQAAAAFMRLGRTIDQVMNKFKQIVGPEIARIVTELTQAIEQNKPAIEQFFKDVAKGMKEIKIDKEAVAGAITGIKEFGKGVLWVIGLLKSLYGMLKQVTDVVNKMFGTNLSAGFVVGVVAVVGALGALLPLLTAIGPIITGVVSVLSLLAVALGGWIPLAITAAAVAIGVLISRFVNVESIKAAWNSVVQYFKDMWNSIATAFEDGVAKAKEFWNGIVAGAEDVVNTMVGWWETGIEKVKGFFNDMWEAANQLWQKIKDLFPDWLKSAFAGGTGQVDVNATTQPQGAFAGGGKVMGPGTSKSDSILARLSRGEFVQRAKAVRHYGTTFMNAVNRLQFPKVPGFAMGGLVPGSQPMLRLVEGRATGPRNILNLSLDGEAFDGMTVADDTFGRLRKHAVKRSLSPRKPNWYT